MPRSGALSSFSSHGEGKLVRVALEICASPLYHHVGLRPQQTMMLSPQPRPPCFASRVSGRRSHRCPVLLHFEWQTRSIRDLSGKQCYAGDTDLRLLYNVLRFDPLVGSELSQLGVSVVHRCFV